MPYIFALVIIIIAAGALLLFREPAEAPVVTPEEPAATVTTPTETFVPEGFTPPTTPPPGQTNNDSEAEVQVESELEASAENNQASDQVDEQQTYTAEASYFTPRRTEHEMLVSLTLDENVVVDANVAYDGGVAGTPSHTAFDAAYKSEVIGKTLGDINLSRVGGASLTSTAFNEAVADIQAQL